MKLSNRAVYVQRKAQELDGSDDDIINGIQSAIADSYWDELTAILYEENQDLAFRILEDGDFDAVIEPMIVYNNQL